MRIPTRYRNEIEAPLQRSMPRMSSIASAFLDSSINVKGKLRYVKTHIKRNYISI